MFIERFIVENSQRRTLHRLDDFREILQCAWTHWIRYFFPLWCLISLEGWNYDRSRKSGITAWHANFRPRPCDSRKWTCYFSKFYPNDMFTRSIHSIQRTNIDQSLILLEIFLETFQILIPTLLIIKGTKII